MTARHIKEWLRVLKEAKKGKNPYLALIAALPDLDTLIADQEKELRELKSKGKGSLDVVERFELAGMVDEYRSLYNFLSCDSHSNIRALISRHIKVGRNDFEVVYYKDEPIETFLGTLDSTAGLLIEASLSMHEAFNSENLGEVQKLLEKLEVVRAKTA
jgi:hypothetical protein